MRNSCLSHFFVFCLLIFVTTPGYSQDNNSAIFKNAYSNYKKDISARNYNEAARHAKIAYETGLKLFGETSKNTAALLFNYGNALFKSDNHSNTEVKNIFEKSLTLFEKSYGKHALELIDPLIMLGKVNSPGNIRAEKKYYNRALIIVEEHRGRNSLLYGNVSFEIGSYIFLTGAQTNGMHLKTAYSIFLSKLGPNNLSTAYAAFTLGKYELAEDHLRKAEKYFLESLGVFKKQAGSDNLVLSAHEFLVQVYEKLHEPEKATFHSLAIGRLKPVNPSQDYQPIYRVHPDYPTDALTQGYSGSVILEFTVDKSGRVVNPKVIKLNGPKMFIRPAINAAKKWIYAPRFVNGHPVVTKDVKTKITFELDKKPLQNIKPF